MKVLMLVPSRLKRGAEYDAAVAAGEHPRMDYHALADALRGRGASVVDLAGFDEVDADRRLRPLTRAVGYDAALAAYGAARSGSYDAIFANGENVSVPLSLLWRVTGRSRSRPGHVTIGHRLTTGKKQAFFSHLHADREMDRIFVYATTQRRHAVGALGIAPDVAPLIAFHADDRFWRPLTGVAEDPALVSSAGLEWRDYPTLMDAARSLPAASFRFAAASPWSKHQNETERRELPANVEARRYDYAGLRDLYARSAVVAVPLYENDFQAGVTTLLEAMSMGKAVVVTRTTGQGADVIRDGENGLTVAPGDAVGWRDSIGRLLADEPLRRRLGHSARRWVEENATLDLWAGRIAAAVSDAASARRGVATAPTNANPISSLPSAGTAEPALSRRS